MLRFSKTKTVGALGLVALFIALYALAGFVIAPKLLRSAVLEDIPKSVGVTAAVGQIHVNPFLFQVTVDEFSLRGHDGEQLLGFERLFVDFDLSSIWHRAYTFGSIDLTAPYLRVNVAQDGALNLMQLRPKSAALSSPDDKNAALPAIRFGSFKVSRASVSYEDRSRPDVFAVRLEPINFEVREFTTGAEGGIFTLNASSKLGERIGWRGHLSVQPIESDGEFRLDGLLMHTVWEYLQDRLNFAVHSGTIDLAATYAFSAAGAPAGGRPAVRRPAQLKVELTKAALTDLTIRPTDSDLDWITVPGLTVTGATLDLAKRQAHADSVLLTGLKLATWLAPDGSFNLSKLAATPGSAQNPGTAPVVATSRASAPGIAPTAPAAASPPWQFDLTSLELRDASIAAEDRTTHPAVKVLLAPFALQVNGVSQDLGKPIGVSLDTRINDKGSMKASGEVWPQPLMANLGLKVADIDLTTLQPYIAQRASLTLAGGKLGGDARLHYGAQKNLPTLQLAGKIDVENLHTVDNTLHNDFINWERLDILGLNYRRGPDRLDIEQIVARTPYVRVIIESDASLNVKRVLAVPGRVAAEPPAATSTQRGTAAPPPVAAAPQTIDAPQARPMPMSIKKVVVQAGRTDFADLTVAPNFSAGIQGLNGTVLGLSSKPKSRAKVDLRGSVGTYSPVSISGEVNVMGSKLYTDIVMNFRNMELSVFNPYSGKFAGYNISKGKLTTDLHYKVDGRKLDAQHHIVIDQLEFGDRTASKDAVSLPIKLAVALLKDRNGVIDLNLPVTGSLDDPTFRLAPIIWKVFVNILEKAITAPFALLGALFGGGPDIQFIDFPPGVSTLDAAAADKVKAVVKALIERPQLKIEVPIGVVADVDRPALVAAQFDARLRAAQTSRLTQLEQLTLVYAKDFGAPPKYPDSIVGLKDKAAGAEAKREFLSNAIREHLTVGEGELQTLGQQRAMAVQQSLLADTQVAAERVFLVANDKAASKDGVVRLELSLR